MPLLLRFYRLKEIRPSFQIVAQSWNIPFHSSWSSLEVHSILENLGHSTGYESRSTNRYLHPVHLDLRWLLHWVIRLEGGLHTIYHLSSYNTIMLMLILEYITHLLAYNDRHRRRILQLKAKINILKPKYFTIYPVKSVKWLKFFLYVIPKLCQLVTFILSPWKRPIILESKIFKPKSNF